MNNADKPPKVRSRVSKASSEGTVDKSVEKRSSGKVVSREEVQDRFIADDYPNPAYVSVSMGLTKNLGDFEFLRADISVSIPTEPNEGGVRLAHGRASALVEEFINMQLGCHDES